MIDRCVKYHLSKDIRSTDSVSIHEETDMIVVSNVDLEVSEVLEYNAVVWSNSTNWGFAVEVLELIEPDDFVSVTDVDVSVKVLELIEPEN